ncbi:MAG: rod shape-determining protein MreC [Candidatus Doudnabacteria bacterium]
MKFIYSKIFFIFAGVLLVVVIALTLQVKGWLQPIEYVLLQAPQPVIKVVNWVVRPIVTTTKTLTSLKNLAIENNNLRQEVDELRQGQVELDQLKAQNEILKDELGFVSRTPNSLVPCTVLSVDAQGLTDVLNLSCGSESGIEAGQAVVAQGYVIAKIVHVGNLTSSAVLLTNAQQSIDAKVSRNNTEGVVKGSFGSGLIFDLVTQSADVQTGDLIITAGIDPKIPRDLLIGELGQQLTGQNDLFKRLTVVSPIKPYTVDHVFVVKP